MAIDKAEQVRRGVNLVREWTARTLKGRYQQSLLGWLWAFIQPAAQAAILTVIFTRVVPIDTGATPYGAFAYVATTAWALLASSLVDMSSSLVDNMNLVNKIYFPREVLPIACMLARLVDFLIGIGLVLVVAVVYRIPFYPLGWLVLPLVVATQLLLVAGIGLAAAALNVFLRDVRSLLLLVTQLWMYASPVIYPAEAVPERFRWIYNLNPMVGIIGAYRDLLLRSRLPGPDFAVSVVMAIALFAVGYTVFKRLEFRLADII
jgi:ABC-type polysaccharide/polyol phosphate export permease